ncbi:hypothetical protein ACFL2O_07815 [Thermodesulfobacteriota bacterium]
MRDFPAHNENGQKCGAAPALWPFFIEGAQMAVKTTLEQLEEVQAAITEVLTSQELSSSSGRVVRANLDALRAYEKELLARYRNETGKSAIAVNVGLIKRD